MMCLPVILVVYCAVSSIAAPALRAQSDVPAVFQHGFNSSGDAWTQTANRLANTFQVQAYTPTTPWQQPWANQAADQRTAISGSLTNFIAVGHSNGGQISRVYHRTYGGSNRLLVLGSLNQGAPLADRALQDGDLFQFPVEVADDIAEAVDYYANEEAIAQNLYFPGWLLDAFDWTWTFTAETRRILGAYGFVASAIAGSYAPVLYDMSPTQSQYFNPNTGLNTAANLQNEANTFSSRVSVRAAFGYPQDMVFYTLTPGYGQTLARARYITFVLADALYNYYEYDMHPDDPYYYDLHDYAYLWGNVALDMQDIDLWWLDEIGALQGFDNYGDALYIDSDGILPITTQQLPGFTAQHNTCCTTHTQEIPDPGVYQQLYTTFGTDFGLPLRMTMSLTGPTLTQPNYTDTWTANVSGGTAPYNYAWYVNGVLQSGATSNTFSYTNDGSNFSISVTVTDAAGHSTSAETDVTVNACGQQIIC
jgi:pimeloyl-ACP methyl ester carboxylesterase